MWWWIPLRSLWRNRRRTLLSVAVIGLGTAISFFVLGFVESSRAQIQLSTVQEYGNLQIASPALWNDSADGYEYLIAPSTVDAIETLLAADPAFSTSTAQLQFPGLLASGERTQVVRVTGIVPENGIIDFSDLVVDGRALLPTDTAGLLVGRSLARRLNLSVGAPIVLTLTTVDGAYNASPFQVVGVYQFTSEQVELQSLFAPLDFAQRLLNTTGIDRIVVQLSSIETTNAARTRIQNALTAAGLPYEVRTWDELSPFYRQLSGYFDALFGFLSLAVFILVFFILLQVLTLAFLERTREIGTLRALGTTRNEVFRLFFTESIWLALLGSLSGIAVGVLLGVAFNSAGIEWRPPGTVEAVTLTIRMSVMVALIPFVVSVVATMVSSVFPAVQASRLQIANALRVD